MRLRSHNETNLFALLDAKQRVFTKVTSPSVRSRLRLFSQGNNDLTATTPAARRNCEKRPSTPMPTR